jgi:hypothetical protein
MTEDEGVKMLDKESERMIRNMVKQTKFADLVSNIQVGLYAVIQTAIPLAIAGLLVWGIIAIMSGIFTTFGWRN